MRMFRSLILAACLGARPASAQSSPGPRPRYADSLPSALRVPIVTTVALAEAEGASWPHRSEPSSQPEPARSHDFAASAPRRCAVATSIGPLRSGEFLIGGNIGGAAAWHGDVKIWWAPMHPSEAF